MLLEIGERIELVGGVELLIVLAVAALNLAIVPWSIGADELVADAELGEGGFKERRFVLFTSNETISEFRAIIGLDALKEEGKLLGTVADEQGRGIGAVFPKGFEVAETAELVEESILVKPTLLGGLPYKAGCRNELHIDLDALAGILHLFVGLGDVFGIWQLYSHLAVLTKETIQAGNGACIAPLPEFYPEHYQSGVGIPAPHIVDQPDLILPVLVRMVMRPVRTILKA